MAGLLGSLLGVLGTVKLHTGSAVTEGRQETLLGVRVQAVTAASLCTGLGRGRRVCG